AEPPAARHGSSGIVDLRTRGASEGGEMAGSLKWVLVGVLSLHGLIHFVGAAKGFGLAEVPQLVQPISRTSARGWLAAGIAVLLAAALVAGGSGAGAWVWTAPVAAVMSQAMIVSSWNDAKWGTIVNVVLLVAAAWAFVFEGPRSLRAEYRREVAARTAAAWP